jgi:type I restriction enzyme, S subunit
MEVTAQQQTIRPGYKQTELGVIPEDWDLKQLKDIVVKVIDNRGKTPPYSNDPDIELIETASISFVNQSPDYSKVTKFVAQEVYDNWFRAHPKARDILISTVGEYSGASAIMEEDRGTIAQNLIALRITNIDPDFVFYWSRSDLFKKQLRQVMMNQAQPSLRVPWLLKFLIPFPIDKNEQATIAEALSAIDSLIEELDKLIVKKRDLKQAVMQQLLTGKRRLPGFTKNWDDKRLGEIAEIVNGGTPRTGVAEYWNGGIQWCTPTDITGTAGKYLSQTARTISSVGLASCSARLLPPGSLLLCTRATIGEIRIAATEICTNQGFKSLICHADVDNEFLYYMLLTMKSKIVEKAIGSTFLEISKKDTALLEIRIPKHDEQIAIAAVLSDMDAEISALEARRDKTRILKQGMMQELLTGKTRLT